MQCTRPTLLAVVCLLVLVSPLAAQAQEVGGNLHGGAFMFPQFDTTTAEIGVRGFVLGELSETVKLGGNLDLLFLPEATALFVAPGAMFRVAGDAVGWDLMADLWLGFSEASDDMGVGFLLETAVYYRIQLGATASSTPKNPYLRPDVTKASTSKSSGSSGAIEIGPYLGTMLESDSELLVLRVGLMLQVSI